MGKNSFFSGLWQPLVSSLANARQPTESDQGVTAVGQSNWDSIWQLSKIIFHSSSYPKFLLQSPTTEITPTYLTEYKHKSVKTLSKLCVQ